MKNSTATGFVRDCMARAISTLPWATLDPEGAYNASTSRAVVVPRTMAQIIRGASATDADLAYIRDNFRLDIETHQTCENWLKADCLKVFLTNLMEIYS